MITKRTYGLLPTLLFSIAIFIFSPSIFGHKVAAAGTYSSDATLEAEVATLLKTERGQRRTSLTYNSILARVAREKAYDMGRRGYYEHQTPEGLNHWDLTKRAGYESWSGGECIMASSETVEETWEAWMNSPGHRNILLGLGSSYYASQVDYGIGHAYVAGSEWEHYWVVIIATTKRGSSSTSNTNRGGSAAPGFSGSGSTGRGRTTTSYPNVIRGADGKLSPASGYEWVDEDDPDDFRVKLMPGLVRAGNGKLRPDTGYVWVNDDPRDFRVELMPGLIKIRDGEFRPAKGYTWVDPDDPDDFRVKPIP